MKMTDRRTFLKRTAAAGALAAISDMDSLFAQEAGAPVASGIPDLVAVRNGTRAEMVRKAVETLGGMQAFVKPGQTVVIKPNIGWNKAPEFGANTHPETVATLVELCRQAGAKEVRVFDHCCHNGAYEGSGVKEAVEKAGGVMVDGGNESQYVQTENPKARKFTSAKVHKAVLEADVYITCPPLKHHSGSEMTACMKNVMGTTCTSASRMPCISASRTCACWTLTCPWCAMAPWGRIRMIWWSAKPFWLPVTSWPLTLRAPPC